MPIRKSSRTKKRLDKHRRQTRIKRSSKGIDNGKKSHLVRVFLEMLNVIKIYHWKTRSFSQHKATDELYSKLNENIDHFIEVLLGKCGNRISLEHVKHISLKDFNHENQIMREMTDFKSFLIGLDDQLKHMGGMTNTDLLNIRDEILASVNQFLYLMTFK